MALVEQVKRKLDITWQDADTDRRVSDIMDTAAITLRHKLGITESAYDFSEAGLENLLFLALCLYEWNHAANEFEPNYANEIAQCRAMHDVAYYRATMDGVADAR